MFSLKVYITPVILVIVALGYFLTRPGESTPPITEKQKGVCWVGLPQVTTEAEIREVKACGINWISQTPFGWQRNTGDTLIRAETLSETPWWGESKNGISTTTILARQQGIQTLLKPHLWVRESWPGEIEMTSESDWQAWFRNYERFILPYAALADSVGIEIFCIGTELQKTVKRPEWIALIRKIRNVYHGKITYASNFSGEFEEVPFWKELDFIGVQAYFPLSTSNQPTLKELQNGWKAPVKRIESIHQKFQKPVLFTELGYRSTPDAAIEPWRWPERQEEVSNETQSKCYEAFFQTVWKLDWIAGFYFWKWYPHTPRRPTDADFTPQGKPAEEVMKNWFVKKD
jgi:hypothetical protein